MFGFVVGSASLVALIVMLKRDRKCGGRSFRGGGPLSWGLRKLFRELDTTPGQEKVIRSEADAVAGRLRQWKGQMQQFRRQAAVAFEQEVYDGAAALRDLAGTDDGVHEDDPVQVVTAQINSALANVHAVLEPDQRRRMAKLIRRDAGARWARHHDGPYRDGAAGNHPEPQS